MVDCGPEQLRRWREHRRDIAAGVRWAFGEGLSRLEPLAVMTDSDNTRTLGHIWYGPVMTASFEPAVSRLAMLECSVSGGFGQASSTCRMSPQGRRRPTAKGGCPVVDLGGQLSGSVIALPTGAGRPRSDAEPTRPERPKS